MAQSYAVIGYVTKVTTGPLGYVARGSSGHNLGFFNTVGEAKRALMQQSSGRMFTWTREDLNGNIESYTATALVPSGSQP
jgi:hypothetical protein